MARTFSGSGQYIDCGGVTGSLNLADDASMAMSCFVNFGSVVGTQTMLAKGFVTNATAYQLYLDSGALKIGAYYITAYGAAWTCGWTAGVWHHVYGQYDTSIDKWSIYSDGIWRADSGTVSGPRSTAVQLTIGCVYADGYIQLTNGIIAEAAVFNGPLTATEISKLAGGAIKPNQVTSKTCLGYWPLNGSSPELDLSGNAHHGTVTGATFASGPLLQDHYRFRTDADAVDATPTWGANEDTTYNPGTSNFRLRVKLDRS